ncbi:MAG: hypothetical protein HUU41_17485 [Bryobacteraceae bacterium]|nr:hypothetical protein [Bryobacteraceae bacterium]
MITYNSFNHNHQGDPHGLSAGQPVQGGGQIYSVSSSYIRLVGNWIDGERWRPGTLPQLVNYGIEIDPECHHITLQSNTASNHGKTGYYITSSTEITLSGESATYNGEDGLFVSNYLGTLSPTVSVKGGTLQSNTTYDLRIWENVSSNAVCLQNDTTVGTIDSHSPGAYYRSASCPTYW